MIALCYEQTPKQSMFPFAIMLQILKNRNISFDCEMSLVIACQIYILTETERDTFHSLSHNNICFRRLEIQHNAFVILLYCVLATFSTMHYCHCTFINVLRVLYCLYCSCQMFGNITICIFLMNTILWNNFVVQTLFIVVLEKVFFFFKLNISLWSGLWDL